jgi:hypothetical protein
MKRCLRGLVILACVAPACGKAVDPGVGADTDGAPVGDDGTGDGDDGADDGGDGDDGDAGSTGKGSIVASSTSYRDANDNFQESSLARASFGEYETERCEVEREEPECRVLACTPETPTAPYPEAGRIVIEVGIIESAEMTPGEDGAYAAFEAAEELFEDGDDLTASAEGAGIPPFAIDLVAPSSIAFEPELVPTPDEAITISASKGHDMVWSPAGIEPTDTVHVTLSAAPDEDEVRREIDCTLPAGVGRLFLTPAALSLMPLGALDFEARVETASTETAGGYEVTFTASVVARNGNSPSDNAADGTVMLTE